MLSLPKIPPSPDSFASGASAHAARRSPFSKGVKNHGFSLMELFFVLAIIGIMLTATIMYFSSLSRSQAIASALQEVQAITQAGAAYINIHGDYDGFTAETVQKTKLVETQYNFTFISTDAGGNKTTLLGVPWTDEAKSDAGVAILSGGVYDQQYPHKLSMPTQQYVIRFTSVPPWACQTLSQQMQLIAASLNKCTLNQDQTLIETPALDFALPKLPDA